MFFPGVSELVVLLIIGAVVIVPFRQIFVKAGFSGWFSVIMLFPFVNLFMLYYLAFAEWPIHQHTAKQKKE